MPGTYITSQLITMLYYRAVYEYYASMCICVCIQRYSYILSNSYKMTEMIGLFTANNLYYVIYKLCNIYYYYLIYIVCN